MLSYGACAARDTLAGKEELSGLGDGIDGDYVIPLELRTVYVYNARNQTFKSQVAQQLTWKLKQEFDRRGRLQVVDDRSRAHVHVYVDLEAYREIPVTFDAFNRPTSVDVIAGAMVKVRRERKTKELARKGGPAPKRADGADDEESQLIDPTAVQARIHYNIRGQSILTDAEAVYRLTDRLAARIALTVETGWYTKLKSERELGQKRPAGGVAGAVDPNSDGADGFSAPQGPAAAGRPSAEAEAAQIESDNLGVKEKEELQRNDREDPARNPTNRGSIFRHDE